MFITYKDKMVNIYAYQQAYFKIEYGGEINKYLGIDLDHLPGGSIRLRQPFLDQSIVNLITGMYKLSYKPTPADKL